MIESDLDAQTRRRSAVAVVIAACTALVAVGCGPVQSTSGISDAQASMERARIHDAAEYSPYEYERAQHFLYKAKHEWGYSNFEAARNYALEARRAADAAYDNTHEAPWRGHPIYGFDLRPEAIEQFEEELEDADDMDAVDDIDESDLSETE